MLTAAKIILVVVLVLLLVVALGVWWLINKLKGVVSAVKEGLSQLQLHPPCRVNPAPEATPKWHNPEQVKKFSDEFTANGFTPLGAFTIPEIIGMQLAAFVKEAESLYGVVYDHMKLPPSINIVCRFEDGSDLTVTNTTFGGSMDRPPGSAIIRLDGGGVAECLAALQAHPAPSVRMPVRGDEFGARFREAYAKEMNWRMKRGGATREEIRREVEKSGRTLTDEEFEELCGKHREAYMMELQRGCLAQYREEHQPAAADWAKMEYRAFAIPETMTMEELRETIELHCELEEEQLNQLKAAQLAPGQTITDLAGQFLRSISATGLKHLGSVQEPVPAEIYFMAMKEDEARADDED